MRALVRWALLAVSLLACSSETPVPFRVVVLGDDPFFGGTATAIVVTVEHDGVRDATSVTRFMPHETSLRMRTMPFGTGLDLVVETELSGLVLARGRSFPFDVGPQGASRMPDVSLGVLGRFAAVGTGDASDPFALVAPDADGAILASTLGIARFVAHAAADGRPMLTPRVLWPATRVGGSLAAMDGGVLVVGGANAGASLVDADGSVRAELDASALPVVRGVALVSIDAATVLAIGGVQPDDALVDDVTRISWDGARLTAEPLAPLPALRSHARATAFVARRGAALEPRVLVVDGQTPVGHANDLVLIDPSDVDPPRSVTLAGLTVRAALCPIDTGLVLLAGGLDGTGAPTGQLTLLVVQPDQAADPIAALSPAPPPLFHARESAVAVPLGSGLALIVGGRDASGLPMTDAEIAEIRRDALPGSVVLTGSIPTGGNITAAAALADHTFLVSSDGALSIYFSPRGT